jgi:predicted nuclease of predicted toxin-antitoxin system
MKLFLDQDVYLLTAKFLHESGHDVVRAADVGLSRATDEDILNWCKQNGRILITRDKDFGELVFLRDIGSGVIFLRILHTILDTVHNELRRILDRYAEEELNKAFVVVEPGRHRFRRLPS